MSFIPDWAPNVHPLVVHFPIALLFSAVFVDALALALPRFRGLRLAAVLLFVLAAAATVAGYLTGDAAAESVTVPAQAERLLSKHETLAGWTMWSALAYATLRLLMLIRQWDERIAVRAGLLVVALGGLYLPFRTAEYGAEMVYRHSVGVLRAPAPPSRPVADQIGIEISPNGSWRWEVTATSSGSFGREFSWVLGNAGQVALKDTTDPHHLEVLALSASGAPVMIVAGGPLENLQADLMVNLSRFKGRFEVVHNVVDASNYDFFAVENGRGLLGRVVGGKAQTYDADPVETSGWTSLRVVTDKDHHRAYVNSKMLVHGHRPAPAGGRTGIRLQGTGTVLLDQIEVQPVN